MKKLTTYIRNYCPCPGKSLEEFAEGQEITPELIDNWLDMSNRGSKGDIYGMTQEKIYESILHSYSPEKLEKELKKNFPYINFIDFTRGAITSRMKAVIFETSRRQEVLSSEKFISIIKLYNYNVTQIDREERNGHFIDVIVLEPNIPDDRTTEVYTNYNGIVYHVTKNKNTETILNLGLRLKFGYKYRSFDERVFLFACRNAELNSNVETIRKILKISREKLAVIKVDLKKNPRKIRLFDDPMMDIGYGLPLYTKEYISPSCLTDISSQFD